MANIISKVLMWLAWLFVVLDSFLMALYLTKGAARPNRPFDVFTAGMFVIPIVICGGLRFWLWRIRNPWLALLPFLVGLFFAWQSELFGILLFPQFYAAFQILSVTLLLAYLPLFVKLQPATIVSALVYASAKSYMATFAGNGDGTAGEIQTVVNTVTLSRTLFFIMAFITIGIFLRFITSKQTPAN